MTRVIARTTTLVLALCVIAPATALASRSMAVQPDGKILLAGNFNQPTWICRKVKGRHRCNRFLAIETPSLVRFNRHGRLDRDFGSDGAVLDFRQTGTSFRGLALTPSGTIVTSLRGRRGFRLHGFRTDRGEIDSSFGTSGVAVGPSFGERQAGAADIEVASRALLVGGSSVQLRKGVSPTFSALSVFDEDGSPLANAAQFPVESSIADLAVQPAGGIVAAGVAPPVIGASPWRALLGRFASGTLSFDQSFAGGDGLAVLERGGPFNYVGAHAVEVAGNRILVAGTAEGELFLARFDEHGNLDPEFGEAGVAWVAPPNAARVGGADLAVQSDGRVVVASSSASNLWLVRFDPDGSVDETFGSAGHVQHGGLGGAIETAPLADDRLLVAIAPGAVARLTSDGNLDPTFGDGGVATASPCRGSRSSRRRIGCIATARVRLGIRNRLGRHPRLLLRVSGNQPLDPIGRVQLVLPRQLRISPKHRRRLHATASSGNRPRSKLHPHRIDLLRLGGATTVGLRLKRGLLRAVPPRNRRDALAFRIRVTFADTSTQTVRVSR